MMMMNVKFGLFALMLCLLVVWGWRIVNWVWIRPRKIEKCLRVQGLKGNSYRVLFGDSKEMANMIKEAMSKPINLFDDILPRVLPLHHHIITKYGKGSFIWIGPVARILMMEPQLIKQILNDNHIFKKPTQNPLAKFLVSGLSAYEDHKWAKHRKIINPAFYLEKLKVTMILNEVLRLYPPATIFNRIIYKETKLGDMTLPPGVHLLMPIILMHYDQELWGEDVKEFKPDRFSQGVAKATNNQLCFFPFSWGPRTCIGNIFALMEAKMALAVILRRFSFELSPTYAHAPSYVLTLQPQHGVHLMFTRL